ncbi:uncharacterized protein LOC142350463 [Convolutriloba macropyga]|uniref:uncharacterized protein LOC142350463 n=1 Tax=Convolutriloba macropyga TaxID=536237 RepID=UPI003F524138
MCLDVTIVTLLSSCMILKPKSRIQALHLSSGSPDITGLNGLGGFGGIPVGADLTESGFYSVAQVSGYIKQWNIPPQYLQNSSTLGFHRDSSANSGLCFDPQQLSMTGGGCFVGLARIQDHLVPGGPKQDTNRPDCAESSTSVAKDLDPRHQMEFLLRVSMEGIITFADHRTAGVLGKTPAQLVGESAVSLVHCEDSFSLHQLMTSEPVADRQSSTTPIKWICSNGSLLQCNCQTEPIYNPGKPKNSPPMFLLLTCTPTPSRVPAETQPQIRTTQSGVVLNPSTQIGAPGQVVVTGSGYQHPASSLGNDIIGSEISFGSFLSGSNCLQMTSGVYFVNLKAVDKIYVGWIPETWVKIPYGVLGGPVVNLSDTIAMKASAPIKTPILLSRT